MVVDSRDSTEHARLRFRFEGRESVHDHGDKQVDQPEVEHDETNDEKEAGYEELRVDHGIYQCQPPGRNVSKHDSCDEKSLTVLADATTNTCRAE
jgi:hypothetical protein